MAMELFGRLLIIGKEGSADIAYDIEKKSVLIGRDHSCDIRIVNKAISRKHAEVYVEDDGGVWVTSMGREPVSLNGRPVESPCELGSGDRIEIQLESRTRVFVFYGLEEETVALARAPLQAFNIPQSAAAPNIKAPTPKPVKRAPAPPPPPPPPKPTGSIKAPAPASPLPPADAAAQPTGVALAGIMPSALNHAVMAGVALKTLSPENKVAPRSGPTACGPFVPSAADLLKLKAGLRKTGAIPHAAPYAAGTVKLEAGQQVAASAEPTLEQQQQATEAGTHASMAEPVAEPMSVDVPTEVIPLERAMELEATKQAAVVIPALQPDDTADTALECEPVAKATNQEASVACPDTGLDMVQRQRKSVRFNVEQMAAAATPEGAACDASITIRLRRGDVEQVINVDDSTVAFAQWGLGTMGGDATAELADTVVSKRSRPSVPTSAAKTPLPSTVLFQGDSVAKATPATAPVAGVQAPAPTPASAAAASAGPAALVTIDAATLTSRLAEMAEQHDVTLEVPLGMFQQQKVDQMGTQGMRVVLTPRSQDKMPPNLAAAPVSAAKSGLGTARSQSVPAQAGQQYGVEVEATQEVLVPDKVFEFVGLPTVVAAGHMPAVGCTPAVSGAHSGALGSIGKNQQRSTSRTPRLVIIERSTQTTPWHASAAKSVRGALCSADMQASPHLLSTIGMQTEGGESSGEDEGVEQVPGRDSAGEEVDAALRATVSVMEHQRALLRARAYRTKACQLAAQLRRMTARAGKLKRSAAVLGVALEGERTKRRELQAAVQQIVTNRDAAEAEAEAAEAEQGRQEALQEQAMEVDEPVPAAEVPIAPAPARVVVLRPSGQPVPAVRASRVEYAGSVVVVRPAAPTTGLAVMPSAPELPTSVCKTSGVVVAANKAAATPTRTTWMAEGQPSAAFSARCTPATSLKIARKTPGTQSKVIVNNVELPGWVFEEQRAEGQERVVEVVAQQVAAAAKDEDAAKPLAEVHGQQQQQGADEDEVMGEAEVQPAFEGEEDEEVEEDEGEFCHVCGQSDEGDVLLLCDGCDNACHLSCCQPPLKRVPKGDWFCTDCITSKQAVEKPKPTSHGGKNDTTDEPGQLHSAAIPARSANTAVRQESPTRPVPAAKRSRGAGVQEEEEERAPVPGGRGKRSKVAAALVEGVPAPAVSEQATTRTTRARAAGRAGDQGEVSTQRARKAEGGGPKAEVPSCTRSRRSRR